MKILLGQKDGGPDSNVRMRGLEIKGLCSVLELHFAPGSREAYHSHAFNAVSWVLSGALWEDGHAHAHHGFAHIYQRGRDCA